MKVLDRLANINWIFWAVLGVLLCIEKIENCLRRGNMKRIAAVLFVVALAFTMVSCSYTGCYTYNVNTGQGGTGSAPNGPVTITDNSGHGAVTSTQTIDTNPSFSSGVSPGLSTGAQEAPSSNVGTSPIVYSPVVQAYKACLDANPGAPEKCDSIIKMKGGE